MDVLFIGNSQSGKSYVAKMLVMNKPDDVYVPTVGYHYHPITIGDKRFNIKDCGYQGGGLRDAAYVGTRVCIIFSGGAPTRLFESNKPLPLKSTEYFVDDVSRIVPDVQFYVVDGSLDEKYTKALEILTSL
jgi:hypothetical protein